MIAIFSRYVECSNSTGIISELFPLCRVACLGKQVVDYYEGELAWTHMSFDVSVDVLAPLP